MLVPVRPSLFMVESQRMQQLVLDDVLENTALPTQRHCLSSTSTTNKREAPKRKKNMKANRAHTLSVKKCMKIISDVRFFLHVRLGIHYPDIDSMLTKSSWPFKGVKRMQDTFANDCNTRRINPLSLDA